MHCLFTLSVLHVVIGNAIPNDKNNHLHSSSQYITRLMRYLSDDCLACRVNRKLEDYLLTQTKK